MRDRDQSENLKTAFLGTLSRINYTILHHGDIQMVAKLIKKELNEYFHYTGLFLDEAFFADYQSVSSYSSVEHFSIVDFDQTRCFKKLKKWKKFFVLNKNSKLCSDCTRGNCKMVPCILIPLKYIDDFYGGLVVSFNLRNIYDVNMFDFLQEVAHNFSSLLYSYTLSHQPNQAKNKIEKYYSSLKERNAELEEKNEELKFLIEENRRAKEQAEESDRLKLAFLGNMSHEIRTPINGIVGFSQLLKSCNIDDKARSYADIVIDSSHKLMKLMDNIINYSKLQANQVQNRMLPCSLNEELNSILFEYIHSGENADREDNKDNKIEVKKYYSLEAPSDYLMLNIVSLREIVKSLLDNAFKFTNEGFIELAYSVYSDYLLFYLRDTGIGVDPKKEKVIFEYFRQSDESEVRKYGGLGLGLSIVKELIDLIHGELWMESEHGKGTTFYFTVPFAIPEENTTLSLPTQKVKDEKIWQNAAKRIVLIENDTENSESIKKALGENYHFDVLTKGEEALTFIEKKPDVDLFLVDFRLPDWNGDKLIKQIKKIIPDVPVIAQVAEMIEKDKQKCFIAGCDDFILKPVDINQLRFKVKAYI